MSVPSANWTYSDCSSDIGHECQVFAARAPPGASQSDFRKFIYRLFAKPCSLALRENERGQCLCRCQDQRKSTRMPQAEGAAPLHRTPVKATRTRYRLPQLQKHAAEIQSSTLPDRSSRGKPQTLCRPLNPSRFLSPSVLCTNTSHKTLLISAASLRQNTLRIAPSRVMACVALRIV
jgi:hypothetical protein